MHTIKIHQSITPKHFEFTAADSYLAFYLGLGQNRLSIFALFIYFASLSQIHVTLLQQFDVSTIHLPGYAGKITMTFIRSPPDLKLSFLAWGYD